jgi:hypothetical protein
VPRGHPCRRAAQPAPTRTGAFATAAMATAAQQRLHVLEPRLRIDHRVRVDRGLQHLLDRLTVASWRAFLRELAHTRAPGRLRPAGRFGCDKPAYRPLGAGGWKTTFAVPPSAATFSLKSGREAPLLTANGAAARRKCAPSARSQWIWVMVFGVKVTFPTWVKAICPVSVASDCRTFFLAPEATDGPRRRRIVCWISKGYQATGRARRVDRSLR